MGKVLRVAIRRCVNAGVTILGIICLNYVLIRLMPGDPNLSFAPRNRQYIGLVEYNRQLFGLDKSPLDQFLIYLHNMFTLDWGLSYFYRAPVAEILFQDLSWTLLLVGTSTVITILIGMVVGSYAAAKRGKPFDLVSTGLGIFFYGMPIFWLAIVLQAAFSKTSPLSAYFSWWPVLPSQGRIDLPPFPQTWSWDWVHIGNALLHLILPALTLSLGTLAGISLVMRSSLIDAMTEDYVLTAKAKGLSDRQVLRRHIFPNGLPPMVSLIALDIAFVVGGAYQVEVVFNYKGIGWRTIDAIHNLDYPLLQFIVVIGGVAIVLANLVSDFILLALDPRIKVA
ncbi:MAG: ABC transporter permease [Methanobacteriota archaeon]|nr:MAG: ABC transporter permease [Euryarchaeota archaeon]